MMCFFHDPLEVNATREDKLSALAENYRNAKELRTTSKDRARRVLRARHRFLKECMRYGLADYIPGYLGRMVRIVGTSIYV